MPEKELLFKIIKLAGSDGNGGNVLFVKQTNFSLNDFYLHFKS